MADVKLVVLYPRPEDVTVFEKVYHRKYLPLAVETRRQYQDYPNQGIGLPPSYPSFLSHRRSSFSVRASSRSSRRF